MQKDVFVTRCKLCGDYNLTMTRGLSNCDCTQYAIWINELDNPNEPHYLIYSDSEEKAIDKAITTHCNGEILDTDESIKVWVTNSDFLFSPKKLTAHIELTIDVRLNYD
jgi:hypothetical protein